MIINISSTVDRLSYLLFALDCGRGLRVYEGFKGKLVQERQSFICLFVCFICSLCFVCNIVEHVLVCSYKNLLG
jgi:hypothetical protein